MKKISNLLYYSVLTLLLISCSQEPSGTGNALAVSIVDDGLSTSDWTQIIFSTISLLVSGIALYQIVLSNRAIKQSSIALFQGQESLEQGRTALELNIEALRQNVIERNLHYLSDMDKMMVENPNLWAFYNHYRAGIYKKLAPEDKKALKFQIKAFIYYKLNNFEIALLDDKYYKDTLTLEAWKEYFRYCLRKSDSFKKIVRRIVVQEADYRGIFKKNFEESLNQLYRETFTAEIPTLDKEKEINEKKVSSVIRTS